MESDKNCPVVVMGGRLEPELCAGEKCAWWDTQGKCCSIKTIAEFRRLDGSRLVTAVGELNNSVDARLGDIVGKLNRLSMSSE